MKKARQIAPGTWLNLVLGALFVCLCLMTGAIFHYSYASHVQSQIEANKPKVCRDQFGRDQPQDFCKKWRDK
jgi:hypothetical protein